MTAALDAIFAAQARLLSGRTVRTVIDAGAYVGDTAVRYAGLFPDAIIHAVEPDPANFADLERFTAGLPNVRRHQLALSDTVGPATLYRNGYAPTHSLLPRPTAGRRYYPADAGPVDAVTVAAITLDRFCHDQGIQRVDVLKLDLQGGEAAALRGAARLIASSRVDVICAEVAFVPHYQGQPMMWQVCQWLDVRGYTLFVLQPDLYGADGQLRYADALFISPEERHRLAAVGRD